MTIYSLDVLLKNRWQEYTEELYTKDLNDQDNHDGVITHLEPNILECVVKRALESITMKKEGKTTRPFRYDLNQMSYGYTVEVTSRFKGLDLIEYLKNYGHRFMTL